MRFQDLGTNAPTIVNSEVMKVADVKSQFPESESVDQDDRDAQIAARQEGFNRRFAPFLQT